MPYQVKVDVFEGPFDLLLYLIKKNELDIYTVSLSHITSEYLDYVRTMQQMDLELAGEFLVIAATLIYIKTQRMLPQLHNPEELEELEQTESDLLNKLQEYQKFKLLGDALWEEAENRQLIFTRNEPLPAIENMAEIPVNATINDLVQCIQKVSKFMSKSSIREVEYEEFTVELKIDLLEHVLKQRDNIEFSLLRRDIKNRVELVVTVLAMLELCRLKHLSVRQPEIFGEIYISKYIKPQILAGWSENGDVKTTADEIPQITNEKSEPAAATEAAVSETEPIQAETENTPLPPEENLSQE